MRLGCLDKHASSIAQIAALLLILAVVVILALHGTKEDGPLLTQLVAGAIGIAGAIAGFSKHAPDTPPGMTSQQTLTTAIPPEVIVPNEQEKLKV